MPIVMSPASTRWLPYQSTTRMPIERQRLERRQEDGVDACDVERRAHDLVGAAAEARRRAPRPAPSPFTTRMPAIVSSTSAVALAELPPG